MKRWLASNLAGSAKLNVFIDSWKYSVHNKDIVYLLGDLAFDKHTYWMNILNSLPGKKILLKGNHDKNRDSWYKKKCFDEVIPFNHSLMIDHDYGKILLTHVPALPNVLTDDRFKNLSFKFYKKLKTKACIMNIHGHTHGKGAEGRDTFDASLENLNHCLTDLDSIIERRFK